MHLAQTRNPCPCRRVSRRACKGLPIPGSETTSPHLRHACCSATRFAPANAATPYVQEPGRLPLSRRLQLRAVDRSHPVARSCPVASPMFRAGVVSPVVIVVAQIPRLKRGNRPPAPCAVHTARTNDLPPVAAQHLMPSAIPLARRGCSVNHCGAPLFEVFTFKIGLPSVNFENTRIYAGLLRTFRGEKSHERQSSGMHPKKTNSGAACRTLSRCVSLPHPSELITQRP
jgi:hypothetical protein